MPPQPKDASFELAAEKGWCKGEGSAVDACLLRASPSPSAAANGGGGASSPSSERKNDDGDCMRELLALQKCLRARTLAERAIRGDNMGRSS